MSREVMLYGTAYEVQVLQKSPDEPKGIPVQQIREGASSTMQRLRSAMDSGLRRCPRRLADCLLVARFDFSYPGPFALAT